MVTYHISLIFIFKTRVNKFDNCLNLYTVFVKQIVEIPKSRIFVERVWNYYKLMI